MNDNYFHNYNVTINRYVFIPLFSIYIYEKLHDCFLMYAHSLLSENYVIVFAFCCSNF